MPASGQSKVKWYKSLSFLGLFALTLVPLWDLGGIFAVMKTQGNKLVLQESSRLIEQIGNNVVAKLAERSRQIEALCRSEASVGEQLPRDARLFKNVVPTMINFRGDMNVAGGGIWPEPFAFTPGVEKRSFFWGRDEHGSLQYFDDYNTNERGYRHDEWYPVVRYSRPGECFWSKSYMDPYSYQPMVTCTVAMRDTQDQFAGVATIDLKLEGLHAFMENMRQRTGGYIFLLDRNNKFLTFPKEEDVEVIGKDEKGNKTRDFLTIADMAKKQPLFAPIADAVHAMNKDITERAKSTKGFRADIATKIDHDSDQIDAEEAEFIAAAIADPLAEQTKDTSLYRKFEIEKDYITGESAIVFLFHVPQSYWKVIIVKPLREAGAVASQITSVLITMITVTVLVGVALAALLLHRFFTIPLRNTTEAVTNIGHVVSEKQFQELEAHKIKSVREDELGQLSGVVNSLASELQSSYGSLLELNQNLEQKVEDRTRRLQQTLEEVSDLKKRQDGDYFLTSLLIKPLAVNRVEGNHTDVRFLMKQKKSFIFKNREDELGGDICLADTIHLHGRTFTVFLNGDAMGKSIQGAGGALVLGAVARMMIERTKLTMSMQNLYPERWLKNAFIEFQKMFESFDGSMLVSVVLGLIDDDSGVLYVINAEHPRTVLYRNGKAAFLEEDTIHRKLGIGGLDGKLQIGTYQLETGDVIIAGSDGRDDILIGMGQDGTRTMNSDETLFVKHVEAGNGNLDQIYAGLVESGEITDDLSLLRVEYRKEASPERKASQEAISRARALAKGGDQTGGVRELEGALGRDPLNPELVRPLIKYYLEKKNFARTAEIAEPLAEAGHLDNEFAFVTAHCRKKLNRLKEAADMAERVYLREPELAKNLFLLAEVYARMGNIARGADFLDKAEKLDPGNPAVAKVRAMFGTQN